MNTINNDIKLKTLIRILTSVEKEECTYAKLIKTNNPFSVYYVENTRLISRNGHFYSLTKNGRKMLTLLRICKENLSDKNEKSEL